MRFEIEVTTPVGARTVTQLSAPLELGRETSGFTIDDPAVSRRHVVLRPVGDGVEVEDLASANGTMVDGVAINGTVHVGDGAMVRIGDSRIQIRAVVEAAEAAAQSPPEPDELRATQPPRGSPADPTPAGQQQVPDQADPVVKPARRSAPMRDMVSIEGGHIIVNSVPGTIGAHVAGSVLDTAKRARKALSGFGSEAWGAPVIINVVDPFADPADPSHLVTGGSVIDAAANTIWMVVTPESPPEDPHRALTMIFGAALPCAAELDYLIEGFGLHLAGVDEPTPELVESLPAALDSMDVDERGPLVASFVGYLISREGEETFRRLLAAPAGTFGETCKELYGRPSHGLEASWRADHEREPPDVSIADFMKMSWRYVRPYRRRQFEVFGYMLLSLAFTVAYPFVTQRLFDDAIPSREMSKVMTLLAVLAAAFAITLIAGLRQGYQSAWIAGSVVRDLREQIFGRLQRVPDAWVGRHSQGDVLSRMMSDVGRVQAGLATAVDDGLFQMVSLVVSAGIMLQVDWLLGVIVLAGAPVIAFVYKRMSAGARTRSLAVQEDNSDLISVLAENYQANAVVKLFGLDAHERNRFRRSSDRLFRSQQRLSLFGGFFGVAVQTIMTALQLSIIGLGAWLIFQDRLTLGGLVAFLGLMSQVLGPVTGLTSLGQEIQSSVGAIIRIDEVLDAAPEPDSSDLGELPLLNREIKFEGVSMSYGPDRRALDAVDVTIAAGSRVAFVGPSGSGKSTIMRMLMRLYEPDEGRITFDGVDIRERSLESLRNQLGVVFQDSFLFDSTLRENISLGSLGATDAEIKAAAQAAEVDGFVANLPRGYDSMVGEGGRFLSGGQRQRVAIARAVIGDPQVLLLDEATSALDPATERQISATLERAGAGRTVIAVTHRLTSIVGYDRIFVVDGGRVVEQGTHDELILLGGVYGRLWAEQTGAPMPEVPPFDLAAVLSPLPLFVDLDERALSDVVDQFGKVVLAATSIVAEGAQLVAIERGRGEIVDVSVPGSFTVLRTVGVGEIFGLNALLGEPTRTQLRATEPMVLHTLSDDDLNDLRSRYDQIAQASVGRSTVAPSPTGRALSRATLSGRSTVHTRTATGVGLTAADVAAAVASARARSTSGI